MRKSTLIFALFTCIIFFGFSNGFTQTSPIPGAVITLIDSSSGPSFNGTYRGSQEQIFFEPTTGNLVTAWYYYYGSSDPDPRRVYAATSLDGGKTWTLFPEINQGVGTNLNGRFPTVKGTADTPIILYRNASTSDPNIQNQPTLATDLAGWGGGVWENIFVDEKASADSVMDIRYYSLDIAPDNSNLWLIGAHHHSGDPPGEFHLVYRSEDGGVTWSRPIPVATAVPDDSTSDKYIIDLSTSSLGVLLGPNNTAFAVGLCQYYSDSDLWRLYYVTSDDGGKTRSKPSLIPGTEFLDFSNSDIYHNFMPLRDAAGNIHIFAVGRDTSEVVSGEPQPYRGWDLRFDGSTWNINKFVFPKLLNDGLVAWGLNNLEEVYPLNAAAVGADGTLYYAYEDVVDTAGAAGNPRYFSYNLFVMVSEDNGTTWKGPVAVLQEWSGRGPNGMARNAGDNLHLVFREYNADLGLSSLYYLGVPTTEVKKLVTSVATNSVRNVPKTHALFQNYPNPFNPVTTIRFDLKEDTQVTLTVFNMLGKKVATLVDKKMQAGYKGVVWDASNLPSGIYFYQLKAGNFMQTRQMVLMK